MPQVVRRGLIALSVLGLIKVLISVYIQLRPTLTPPAVKFLLTSRLRRLYRDPERTLAPLGILPGMRVLELGCGPGLFTTEAARRAGSRGRVICVDTQIEMLRPLRQLVRAAELRNVVLNAGLAEQLPLADACVDLAFAIAVLPMIADKRAALRELRRVLRPNGVLAISEELLEPEYVPAGLIKRWCRQAGLQPIAQFGGPWCYMLLFRRGQ